ncbi:hypothetical protein [Rarobacter incanus]|uniref:Uncharacterized protein n=1 Tax=Rarobacter incanus TaxID=153494 RepID=A0A542SR95_9MICO|nr:hypothetical protein [Rarobacter incanus]TQK77125.1 hypothetical protein FB389_1840 [Rarobacter incanus]
MTQGPNYYDPKELFGQDYDGSDEELEEDGEIEIVPSEDGDGFEINGPVPAILDLFTSGILDIVEQAADDGDFDPDTVATVIKAVAQIREAVDLD